MTTSVAALLNLLGFITGAALYAMLLVMVFWQLRAQAFAGTIANRTESERAPDRLPLLTALLGLAWNVGALTTFGFNKLGVLRGSLIVPLLIAATFTALGFLPAVVVHSVLRTGEALRWRPVALVLVVIAYSLSAAASIWHFTQAITYRSAPAHWALHTLTLGFGTLIVALLVITRGQAKLRRASWVVALAVFAVSALHLSHHEGREFSWWVELIGHHASLPLAVAILYQDYRFALADIFLKRALALVFLVALGFGLYLGVVAPLLQRSILTGGIDPLTAGLLLGLWIATALVVPLLWRSVNWFVDAIVLRRVNYEALWAQVAQRLVQCESPEQTLDEVCARLASALTAREIHWSAVQLSESREENSSNSGPLLPLIQSPKRRTTPFPRAASADEFNAGETEQDAEWRNAQLATASVLVPTSEAPQYRLLIGELAGGRRLLSDDLALLEALALLAARRIDNVRVVHERCVRDLHEEEMRKLATEAELRALRAQINPHFLFNALTTIGYLIQTAPERALKTLLQLTSLLRGVLRHGDGGFSTLGEEVDLIEAYLEIERARFEERLRMLVDVPLPLRSLRIPAPCFSRWSRTRSSTASRPAVRAAKS